MHLDDIHPLLFTGMFYFTGIDFSLTLQIFCYSPYRPCVNSSYIGIFFIYLFIFLHSIVAELANMLSSIEEIELTRMVDDKIRLGDELQKRFEPFIHIEGAIKIQKKISREIKYLEKVCCR